MVQRIDTGYTRAKIGEVITILQGSIMDCDICYAEKQLEISADCQAKVSAGLRKAVHNQLKVFKTVHTKSCIISIERLTNVMSGDLCSCF